MEKLRLKRHGSFSVREGWFEKAISSIVENDKSIFGKENGVSILGIGANMVTSLRYWLIASGIIYEKNSMLTEFGQMIAKYDPYLDQDFTWWMIHQHLVSNRKDAPIFNIVFNEFGIKNFSKEMLNNFVLNYMKENNIDLSNANQVEADTTVLLRTYVNEKISNPEDNLNSPFGKLNLLSKSKDGLYNFKQPSYEQLNYQVVYSVLVNCLKGNDSVNIDDLFSIENSPFHVLKLDKNLMYMYLNEMSQAGLVTVNKTAGLNMIYVQKAMSEIEIFEHFFKEVKQ